MTSSSTMLLEHPLVREKEYRIRAFSMETNLLTERIRIRILIPARISYFLFFCFPPLGSWKYHRSTSYIILSRVLYLWPLHQGGLQLEVNRQGRNEQPKSWQVLGHSGWSKTTHFVIAHSGWVKWECMWANLLGKQPHVVILEVIAQLLEGEYQRQANLLDKEISFFRACERSPEIIQGFFLAFSIFWVNNAPREWSRTVIYSTMGFLFDSFWHCWSIQMSHLHKPKQRLTSSGKFWNEPTDVCKVSYKSFEFQDVHWRREFDELWY